MVKYFSVDWLAQSHHTENQERGSDLDASPTCRPHVPCMVQPRPPAFGKTYLQPKPLKPVEHMESTPNSPLHPTSCASPISEICGYSSGYESEAASSSSSECLSVDEAGSEAERDAPQRRVRSKFTPEQIEKLEQVFNKHKYLDAGERVKTAQRLNLTETQVRTWFQNRRMKLKREVQDYLAPQVPAVMFQPLPPVQYHHHHGMAPQRPLYPTTAHPCPPAFYPLPVPVPQLLLQPQQQQRMPPHGMIHSAHFY